MQSTGQFPLVKIIKTTSGWRILRSINFFCYRSIVESIGEMVQKLGMFDLPNHWKSCSIHVMALWQIFMMAWFGNHIFLLKERIS